MWQRDVEERLQGQDSEHHKLQKSMHYNPFAYVHSEKDILKLVTTLMTNTKGEGSGGDPFWEKSERLLLTALIAYLHYEAPVEEQNFATLLEMLNTMQVLEDDEEYQNPVDLLFEELAKEAQQLCRATVQSSTNLLPVLYALKDFLIKWLGSLLEHTT